MTRTKVIRTNLIDEIASQLEDAILTGEYSVGSRLPAEAELAAQFDVSRPVLRESLERLRTQGFIRTVNGLGSYVQGPDLSASTEALIQQVRLHIGNRIDLDDLYEVRRTIEIRTVEWAARHADAEDLRELEQSVSEMERAVGKSAMAYSVADAGFHLSLARASRNALYPVLLGPIVGLILRSIFLTVRYNKQRMQSGIKDHRRIIEVVREGNVSAAIQEMNGHLDRSRRMQKSTIVETGGSIGDWTPRKGVA